MQKRDFGSFHVSNVQDMLAVPEDDYSPPEIPFTVPNFDAYKCSHFPFGSMAKNLHFLLEDQCCFINHGAFGAVLKDALLVAQKWQTYIERQPLRFFDRELLPQLVSVTRRLAQFVGCDHNDLVLVPNVTTAINCVLRSQLLKEEDTVFIFSTEYGAVKKIVKQVCLEQKANLHEVYLPLPIESSKQICQLLDDTLPARCQLVVIDHIASNAALVMPVKELIERCHQRGARVLVDGAHALGSLPLQLDSLQADYYVCNAHKWLCAPKGCAMMYVAKPLQTQTRPLVISHGFGSGFNSEFIWSGLKDYSGLLSLLTVLDFWQAVGPNNIRAYMNRLVKAAGELLVNRWRTQLLVPPEMSASMLCVLLPKAIHENATNYDAAEAIQNKLYHEYNIEVPIKSIEGRLYVRISAHIYNTMEEYKKLADAMEVIAKPSTVH